MDPPIVPLFLTWGSPISSARTAREEMEFPTSLEAATAACVVVAQILTDLLETLMPDNPLIFFIFISSEYAANLSFIAGKRVIPPAKKAVRPEAIFVASLVFAADLKLKLFIFFPYAAVFFELFFFIAFQTFSAVAGIETSVPTASITAFITAGGAAIVPASPHPLAPNGFEVAGVDV